MTVNFVWGPTFEEMLHPERMPAKVRAEALQAAGSDPLSPANLFNITWRDGADRIRHVILPPAITGIEATICVLVGSAFPTGSHKVGATYSCTVERQARGEIVPGTHRLVWPSTGNYGIGGAYVGARMGYESLVVLPTEMSRERFEMIASYGGSYVKTPGSESNVKEIYDKTKELAAEPETVIVNQFADFGNYRFHAHVTGGTLLELFAELSASGVGTRFAGFVSAMGSAGTIAAGDRVKEVHPNCRVVGLEPVQCPTLYANGFGAHDIQGIGDKHVTWIHHTDAMDALICIDEWDCKNGMQLFCTAEGLAAMERAGAARADLECLRGLFGISGICNVLGAIKAAKHWRMGRGDVLVTVATDDASRYGSVLTEMERARGPLTAAEADRRLSAIFHRQGVDYVREGTQHAHDCWANLKYFTWVEQQGKDVAELRAQRSPEYWARERAKVPETDRLIRERRGY